MDLKNLFKALAAFQQEVPIIHKGTKGFGYSYADLPAIFPIINPLLQKHGLGFTQLMESQGIKTIVFHSESGETIESFTDIPQGVKLAKMNDFQVLGSAVTYIRRYALSAALGLVTDKDNGMDNKQISQSQESPNKTTVDYPNENTLMDNCKTLAELQKVYLGLTPSLQKVFFSKKEELKTKLK